MTNVNFDETIRLGLELFLDHEVHESLGLRLDYTWVNAEIDYGANDGEAKSNPRQADGSDRELEAASPVCGAWR